MAYTVSTVSSIGEHESITINFLLSGTSNGVNGTVTVRGSNSPGGPYNFISSPVVTVIDPATTGQVVLTGLSPGFPYFWVLDYDDSVQPLVTSPEANDFTMLIRCTGVGPNPVTDTTATINGEVNYIPTTRFSRLEAGPISGGPYTSFSPFLAGNETLQPHTLNLVGLIPSTTYFYRTAIYEADQTTLVDDSGQCGFATQAALVPNANCSGATGVGQTSATVNGNVSQLASPRKFRVEYGTVNGGPYTFQTPFVNGNTGVQNISIPITGLNPLTTYYYRVVAYETDGTTLVVQSTQCTFTTTFVAVPTASCNGATIVTPTSATLNGAVDQIFVPRKTRIEYGTTPGGPYTGFTPFVNGTGAPQTLAEPIVGLIPGFTVYYYRTAVYETDGTTLVIASSECTFQTLATPAVFCEPITNLSINSATLNGSVVGLSAFAGITFEYGTTPGGPYPLNAGTLSTGAMSGGISVGGLLPLTQYYYIMTSREPNGGPVVAVSSECTFTTFPALLVPNATCTIAFPVTASTATLEGVFEQAAAPRKARIEYGTTSGGPYTGFTPFVNGNGTNQNISQNVLGLLPATNYFFRVAIYETDGTTLVAASGECNFTTVVIAADCGPTNGITFDTAILNGEVDNVAPPRGSRFQYGTTPGGPYPFIGPQAIGNNAFQSFGFPIFGLLPSTTYYYRRIITEADLTTIVLQSPECFFTTDAAPLVPVANCSAATPLGATTATLNGTFSGTTGPRQARIEYGTTPGGPYTLFTPFAVGNGGSQSLAEPVTGLLPLTQYYQVTRVYEADGTTLITTSPQCSFTTTAIPVVNCDFPTNVYSTTAILNGNVDLIVAPRKSRIEWGTVSGGPYTNFGPFVNGTNAVQNLSLGISGLTPGASYYSRVAVYETDGTTLVATSGECFPTTTVQIIALCNVPVALSNTSLQLDGNTSFADPSKRIRWEIGTTSGGPYTIFGPFSVGATGLVFLPSYIQTGLLPSTTYFVRLAAYESDQTTFVAGGSECTQTTLAGPLVPFSDCLGASTIDATTATVTGFFGDTVAPRQARIDYGTTAGGPYPFSTAFTLGTVALQNLSIPITGLIPLTQYFFRVRVYEADGTTIVPSGGGECDFTTLAISVACSGAVLINPTTATLVGSVDNVAAPRVSRIRYGTTNGGPYPLLTPTVLGNNNPQAINAPVVGLSPSTTYYYQTVVLESDLTTVVSTSTQCSFTTLAAALPVANCSAATLVTDVTATLNGNVNTVVGPRQSRIEYGTTSGGPYTLFTGFTLGNGALQNLSAPVIGLTPLTSYYYRTAVYEADGTTLVVASGECTFTTQALFQLDPAITKTTITPGPYIAPQVMVSVVVVTNPNPVINPPLVALPIDPVPPVPAGISRTFTSIATGGATGNTAVGVGGISDVLNMPGGSTVTYTVTDTIPVSGNYQNIASLGGNPPVNGGGPFFIGGVSPPLGTGTGYCAPACAPNIASSLPNNTPDPVVGPPITVVQGPTTATGVNCAGAVVTQTAVGVVQSIPHPTAVQLVRMCPSTEFDTFTLCDPTDGRPIIVVTSYSTTGVPTSTAFEVTGAPYVGPIASLVSCASNVESDPQKMCDNNTTTFIRWFVKDAGSPTGVTFDTDDLGNPYVPVGPVTFGECQGEDQTNNGISSGIIRITDLNNALPPTAIPVDSANGYEAATIFNTSDHWLRAEVIPVTGNVVIPGNTFQLCPPRSTASFSFDRQWISSLSVQAIDITSSSGAWNPATAYTPLASGIGTALVIVNFVNK